MQEFSSFENPSFEVEGISLDRENAEFNLALDYVCNTRRTVYLTGKAGSGKTTFLKYLRKVCSKNMVVLAPTGVAAVNAGGQTIHSFFQIPPSLYVPGDRRLRTRAERGDTDRSTIFTNFHYRPDRLRLIRSLELIVIDEVSMVRCDLLDVVDTLLRTFRRSGLPFGGVQMLFIGDAYQLPPIVKDEDKQILFRYYQSEFFFSARAMKNVKPVYIELKKIYRQSDRKFIDLLNRVRENRMEDGDFKNINSHLDTLFQPSPEEGFITLATTNAAVNQENSQKLGDLPTALVEYDAAVEGDFPENIRPTDTVLSLKVGAQVMFLRNDREKRYYNGKIGKVTALSKELVTVKTTLKDGSSQDIAISRETWENVVYKWDEEDEKIEEEVIGTFTQFPLRLAWAITVHKSQGLTFEKVVADVEKSFAPGQVYVALSRCTSLDGLVLRSEITPWSVKTDSRVQDFARKETPGDVLRSELDSSKADYYYEKSRRAMKNLDARECLANLYRAMRLRNDFEDRKFQMYVFAWMRRYFSEISFYRKENRRLAERVGSLEDYNEFLKMELSRMEAENRRKRRKDDSSQGGATPRKKKKGKPKAGSGEGGKS